jgi:hypothetical protein
MRFLWHFSFLANLFPLAALAGTIDDITDFSGKRGDE